LRKRTRVCTEFIGVGGLVVMDRTATRVDR
jgi:hypothetical protein